MPVLRTDGGSLARCTVTLLPNFLAWADDHISLAMGLRPRAALRYNTKLEGSAAPLKGIIMASFVLRRHVLIDSVDEEYQIKEVQRKERKTALFTSFVLSVVSFYINLLSKN